MDIRQISINDEYAKKIFPDIVRGVIRRSETSVFAAIEFNSILAALVVSGTGSHPPFIINHLYLEKNEDPAVLSALIARAEDLCRAKKADSLAVKLIGTYREYSPILQVLLDNSYIPISYSGYIIRYTVEELLDTVFGEQADKLSSMAKHVCSFADLDKRQLTVLRETLKKSSIHEQVTIPDMVFGRFFVVDGDVMGFMDAREISPEVIVISDIYIKKHEKTQYALPTMIASLIYVLRAFMTDDTCIYVQSYSEGIYHNLTSVFGEPSLNLRLFEYGKKL